MSEASSGSNVEFAGIPATRQFDLQRSDDFSYVCNRCKRCCHNKAIPLNPYEVVRLAHRLGVSTGEFIEQSTLGGEGTFLRFHPPEEGGACVFLGEEGCSVHSDRPTACRVYPLGRWSAGPGVEAFARVDPEPGSLGVYGSAGTVGDFLKGQGVEPYFEAAERYVELFTRLADVSELVEKGELDAAGLPDGNWLDVDSVVGEHCAGRGLTPPADPDALTRLHIEIIEGWLDAIKPGAYSLPPA